MSILRIDDSPGGFGMEPNSKPRVTASVIAKSVGVGALIGVAGAFIGIIFDMPLVIIIPIAGAVAGVIAVVMVGRRKPIAND